MFSFSFSLSVFTHSALGFRHLFSFLLFSNLVFLAQRVFGHLSAGFASYGHHFHGTGGKPEHYSLRMIPPHLRFVVADGVFRDRRQGLKHGIGCFSSLSFFLRLVRHSLCTATASDRRGTHKGTFDVLLLFVTSSGSLPAFALIFCILITAKFP